MRALLVAVAAFGAAGLELSEAALLLLVVARVGSVRAVRAGAIVAAVVVVALASAVGTAVVREVPVTSLRLYIGTGLILVGGGLWARAIHNPQAASDELGRESEDVRRGARTPLLTGLIAAKVVFLEGAEAAALTLGIGAPKHQLLAAVGGTAVAVVAVLALMVWASRALSRLNARVLDRVAGSALLVGGSLWVSDATHSPVPLVASAAAVVVLAVAVRWRDPGWRRAMPRP